MAIAFATFRQRIGKSQEGLARELGCSSGTVSRWERGKRTPGGKWFQKLLALWPEEAQGLLTFKSEISNLQSPAPAKAMARKLPAPRNEEQEELLRLYSDASRGLELLWEAAMAGSGAAKNLLANFADKLTTRGGDWRRMKYFKAK